jgi:hypothetical protein
MPRVKVEAEEIELGEHATPGLMVTCTRCDESVEVFGTSGASLRAACVMLRDGCEQKNFYYCEDFEDDD